MIKMCQRKFEKMTQNYEIITLTARNPPKTVTIELFSVASGAKQQMQSSSQPRKLIVKENCFCRKNVYPLQVYFG